MAKTLERFISTKRLSPLYDWRGKANKTVGFNGNSNNLILGIRYKKPCILYRAAGTPQLGGVGLRIW